MLFRSGSIFGSMSYLAITASDLSDRMLADFLDMESTQIVTMHIQSVDIPGLGRLLVDSIQMRDYKVVQALLLFFATEYILINLIVDVLYGVINPRVRYE